jgi:hypothetical protein
MSMTITLKLKRPQNTKSVIYTQFKKNGQAFKLYTGKSIYSRNWSIKLGKVKAEEENAALLNRFLEDWKSTVKRIFLEMETNKERITEETIRVRLKQTYKRELPREQRKDSNGIEITDFTSFMDYFLEQKRNDGNFLQKLEQTRKTVLIAFNLTSKKTIKEYYRLSRKSKSQHILPAEYKLPFGEINFNFLQRFKDYLNKATFYVKKGGVELEKHYTTNYIDKQINGLKQFINGAIEANYVKHFTWDSLKSNGNEVDTVYTDFNEIQTLYNYPLIKESEIKIRDKYVFNCFMGFRYSDLNRLEPHLFRMVQIKGIDYLVYSGRSQKTGELLEFPAPPIAAALLKKYNFKIPKYSSKEFNEVIKTVAEKAGLSQLVRVRETRGGNTIVSDIPKHQLICSHTARRSFCTNFYVEGMSITIIMSISGHKTEKEFMKYIKKRSVRLEVAAEQISAIKAIRISDSLE